MHRCQLVHRIVTAVWLAALAAAVPATAQNPAPASRVDDAFLAAYFHDMDQVADKLTDLAAAIPADHYDWRPQPGVRSVAEVYAHVVGANLFLAGALGAEAPDGLPRSLSSIQEKAEVARALRLSLAHLRQAVEEVRGQPLDRTVDLGREGTLAEVLFRALAHLHEHLGQLVAYARSNDVVPPWSRSEGP